MTAEQAHKLADESSDRNEIDSVLIQIEQEARHGNKKLIYWFYLGSSAIDKLREMGYTVHINTPYKTTFMYTIEWKEIQYSFEPEPTKWELFLKWLRS